MDGNSRRGVPSCQTPPVSSIVSGFGRSSWSCLSNGVHGHGDHRSDVRDTGRQNERVVGLGQLTEFGDVLFGDPQLNRLLASGDLNGLGDLAQSFGCGLGDGKDRGSRTVRLWFKPYVTLVWLGAIIMALAGALSLSDRRLRVGVARRTAAAKPAPAE